MTISLNKSLLFSLPVVMLMASCKKDTKDEITPEPTPTGPTYNIPTTYNFTSVDFTTSTQRIQMLGEITAYIRTTHTTTVATQPTLDAQKLKDMYSNAASRFANTTLNTSGIQLKDK